MHAQLPASPRRRAPLSVKNENTRKRKNNGLYIFRHLTLEYSHIISEGWIRSVLKVNAGKTLNNTHELIQNIYIIYYIYYIA